VITLALVTGIPAESWAREGARGIATAWDVLEEMHKQRNGGTGTGGVQYSG
jgi:hypothetical protein